MRPMAPLPSRPKSPALEPSSPTPEQPEPPAAAVWPESVEPLAPPADVEPPIVTPDFPPARITPSAIPVPPSEVVHDTPVISAVPETRRSGVAAAASEASPPPIADVEPRGAFARSSGGIAEPPSRSPMAMIVVAIIVLAAAAAAYFVFGRKTTAALAPDSTTHAAPPASPVPATAALAPAPAAAMGYLRISGDLPEGAIIWVDGTRKSGRVIPMAPGSYAVEIETSEFEAWEERFTVRAGDTTRVRVELQLKADSTQSF